MTSQNKKVSIFMKVRYIVKNELYIWGLGNVTDGLLCLISLSKKYLYKERQRYLDMCTVLNEIRPHIKGKYSIKKAFIYLNKMRNDMGPVEFNSIEGRKNLYVELMTRMAQAEKDRLDRKNGLSEDCPL